MNGWGVLRLAVYAVCFLAALKGFADFDPASGNFDLYAFNVYDLLNSAAGLVGSGLALLAVVKGWKTRKD